MRKASDFTYATFHLWLGRGVGVRVAGTVPESKGKKDVNPTENVTDPRCLAENGFEANLVKKIDIILGA